MALELSERDRGMLEGAQGGAAQMAMRILVRMAEVFGARELMDITGAHIDSTIYIGEAGLEYAEKLASLGGRVAVPTTLNVSGLDEQHWQEWPVPKDWAEKSHRQMIAYQSMGTVPTWTCAPYQTEYKPALGQQVAWGESNAIVFANSVLGARTERYPDLLDICCAITGRVPAYGLHLTENRAGEMLLQLVDVPREVQQDDVFYPVLGHLMGKLAQDRIPVVDGLTVRPTEDQLKALGAAAASSGTVALFHIAGVTPEAPTLEAAFQGKQAPLPIEITLADLQQARRELTTNVEGNAGLDMVVLGSPHFSLAEFKQLAPLLAGKHTHPRVEFLVTSSRAMALLAKQAGYLDALEAFGGKLTVDTCILASPMLSQETKTLMTNSAKYAYYAPGMLNTRVTFGSLTECVESAVEGRVVRSETGWSVKAGNSEELGGPSTALTPSRRTPSGTEGQVPHLSRGRTVSEGSGVRGRVTRGNSEGSKHGSQAEGGRQRAEGRRQGSSGELGEGPRVVIRGKAEGELLVSSEPISFWGGYDYHTGEIIDRRHPLSGKIAAGHILAVPFTRGSSTTSAVLLEAVRAGTAPAAIITTGVDSFFALASIVAEEMYGTPVPLLALSPDEFAKLRTGDRFELT